MEKSWQPQRLLRASVSWWMFATEARGEQERRRRVRGEPEGIRARSSRRGSRSAGRTDARTPYRPAKKPSR